MKIYLAIILIILVSNSVSGYLLSDQGTDTEEIARGNPLASGNLTIEIYDHPTGGNLIFSQSFNNGIVDGSWNVMINPRLEYGKSYWKDYKINGEDLDFDGNERMEFQSPLGLINNVSFINLSLINYCPVGSSIRQVYENGSVECEANVTHSNSSTWWASLTGWVSGWFVNTDNQLDFNETKMNNSIDARASVYNETALINGLNATKLDASDQKYNDTALINAVNTSVWTVTSILLNLRYNETAQINNLNATKLDASDQRYNETAQIAGKLDASDQRYNETALINAVNTSANIKSFGFNLTSELNNIYALLNADNYFTGTNNFKNVSVNGTLIVTNATGSAVLFVNSTSGNVGIGTTSPGNYDLNVFGDINATTVNATRFNQNGEPVMSRRIYNLNADVTTLSATVWNETFNMSVSANTNYTYECNFFVLAAATGTGVFINITAPATPTWFSGGYIHPTTATAANYVYCDGAVRYCQSLSLASLTTGLPVRAWGRIINVNAGYVVVYTRSEVAASSTVKRGSYCAIWAE